MQSALIGLLSGPLLYIAQADFPAAGFMSGGAEKITIIGLLMGAIWVVVKAYAASNEARIAEIKSRADALEKNVEMLQKALLNSSNIDLSNTTRRSLIESAPKSDG